MSIASDMSAIHGLSDYHQDFLKLCDIHAPFRGKRVLEIGGHLPRAVVVDQMGAARWTSIVELSYYETVQHEDAIETHGALSDLIRAEDLPPYGIYSGRAEQFPQSLDGQFDVILSIACFEHLDRLPLVLERAHAALVPGGVLFSVFGPLWPYANGHHLHRVTDQAGNFFDFANSPVPFWGHLIMTPPEMYQHLLAHTDSQAAAEIVYNLYHSPCINRLFCEDYMLYAQLSPFAQKNVLYSAGLAPPPEVLAALIARYPGRERFNIDSMGLILRKAD